MLTKLTLGLIVIPLLLIFDCEVHAQNRKNQPKNSSFSVTLRPATQKKAPAKISATNSRKASQQAATRQAKPPGAPETQRTPAAPETQRTPAAQPIPAIQRATRAIAKIELLHPATGKRETRGQGFFIAPQLFVTHMHTIEPMIIESQAYTLSIRGQGFSYPATPEAFNPQLGIVVLRTQFSHSHQIQLGSLNQEDHFYPSQTLTLDEKLRGVLTHEARSAQSIGAPKIYSDFTLGGLSVPKNSRGIELSAGLINRYLSGYLQMADRQIASITPWMPTLEKAVLDRQNEIVEEAIREPLSLISPRQPEFAKSMSSFRCREDSTELDQHFECSLSTSLYEGTLLGLGEIRIQNLRRADSNHPQRLSSSIPWAMMRQANCESFKVKEAGKNLRLEVCTAALPSSSRLKFVELKTQIQDQDIVIQMNGFERASIQRLIRYFTQVLGRAA